MKRWLLILTFAALPHGAAPAQDSGEAPADVVTVSRVRQEDKSYYEIRAQGYVRATPQATWEVLTDYNHLAEFVPNLDSSKLVSRNGDEAIVEQTGKAGFLFISHSVHMLLRVAEKPISTIDITLVSGSMKHYESHWEILPARRDNTGGTLISYAGKLEPNFFVPPLFGPSLIRSDMQNMLAAMIKEIEARDNRSRQAE